MLQLVLFRLSLFQLFWLNSVKLLCIFGLRIGIHEVDVLSLHYFVALAELVVMNRKYYLFRLAYCFSLALVEKTRERRM